MKLIAKQVALQSEKIKPRKSGITSSMTAFGMILVGLLISNFARASDSISSKLKEFVDMGTIAPSEMQIPLTVVLDFKDETQLDRDLADIYNPESPNYHHFLAPGEFRTRYAPQVEQVSQATEFLKQEGFSSVRLLENGYVLNMVGNSDSIQRAFGCELHRYKDAKGTIYYAPSQDPVIPPGLPFKAVHGLHNVIRFHSHTSLPQAAVAAKPGLTPAALKKAYNFPQSASAKGQCVALFEMTGYDESDISKYEKYYSINPPSIKNILVDQSSPLPETGDKEAVLDIEMVLAIAPELDQIVVYEGLNDTFPHYLDTYAKIANDDLCTVVSTSWGAYEERFNEDFIESENKIFKQMAAQGQSVFASTGDHGDLDGATSPSAEDPASQPYVTAVGGTHLNVDSNGNYISEVIWNNTSEGYATGGGISSVWSIPSWQKGLSTAQNKGSSTMRNIPDVTLTADYPPGFSIFYQNAWSTIGGTSGSAPIWAAFAALVNHRRQTNGPIGFLNPALYKIAKSSRYADDFHDVTQGDNGLYPATPGYDDASGLGSLNAANLLDDLAAWKH